MAGRGARIAGLALACGLVGVLLPALPVAARVSPARLAPPATTSVPAYDGTSRLRARVPSGGLVNYRLPTLPDGGTRVLGDWDGDGAQTPGTFVDGQWTLWDRLVRSTGPHLTVEFGQTGDLPVVGDWNGDGVTDLGVVRGSEWFLALGPFTDGATPAAWRDLTFGQSGDLPVVGDWDGDGTDGIGTFSGGRWTLAPSVDDLSDPAVVTYGAPGDDPVVGDWNGDGADGLGVARGSSWYLSDATSTPRTVLRPTLARAAGDHPETWRVPVSAGMTCPTRTTTGQVGDPAWVVPSAVLDRDLAPLPDRTTRQVRGSLESSERYLLGTRYDALWRATRAHAYLSLLGRPTDDELSIRLPAMSALTVAIGLRTGAFDPAVVGVTTQQAGSYVRQLVRSIACEHETITPGGWGLGWQTPHWAMLTGAAAWLMWDRLTPETRADVTTMLVSEADRQATLSVPYWGRPDGTIASPGNTRAEEDSWNAALLSLAAAMMPRAPHAALWKAKSAELAVAAFATHGDDAATTLVNGVSLADRLQGFNAYPDGSVENHGIIHPDYAAAVQLLWQGADFDRLARQRAPEALFHNGGLVYSGLSTVGYQAGAVSPAGGVFAAPGGTVYERGTNRIYYPQGDDWGLVRRAHFVSLDAHATAYAGYLRAGGWPASDALAAHEQGQRYLVRTSGATDGRTYSVDPATAAQQDVYPGREEYAAESLATAWLALYVRGIGLPGLDRSTLAVPVATARSSRPPDSARLTP